jgi:hypothetical protein
MLYSSTILFAALTALTSISPVFACRGENNATMVKIINDHFVSAGPDQYNIKLDSDHAASFALATGPSRDFGFCVNVSVLDSSDVENAITDVMFWKTIGADPLNAYFLQIRNGQYRIVHQLFDTEYELVPWTTNASIKKGLQQKNNVDVRVAASGADIQINGIQLPILAARLSAAERYYGVKFETPKTGSGLFRVESPRAVK